MGVIKRKYSIEEYNLIDPLKVWSWIYNQPIHVGSKVLNMLRSDRSAGSAIIYQTKNKIVLHDFAVQESYSALDYYMRLSGKKFSDAINDICSNNAQYVYTPVEYEKSSTDITFTKRGFNRADAAYWLSYGINSKQLKEDRVAALKYFCIGSTTYVAEELSYALQLNDKVKIYQPLSTVNKWKGNMQRSDYWSFVRHSRYAIVTSSYKDGRVIFNNSNADVYAPQAERKTLPLDLVEILKSYDYVYVLYNGDKTGIENSISLCALCGYIHYEFPIQDIPVNVYGKAVKDYAELYRYDLQKLKDCMNNVNSI